MDNLLKKLIEDWKKNSKYEDVQALYWIPNDKMVEKCPDGCSLEIYEGGNGWRRITGYDAYRQTKICRTHGFARIYVITGPTALSHNWSP